jgi:spore germination cell wall hydrolase CwlJ-like protein
MTDADLIALCVFQEANLEPDDGLAAVARVVMNRMRLRFQSDGSVAGTVFHANGTAFSWAAFEMVEGRYSRVADGPVEIEARAADLLAKAQRFHDAWARAQRIASQVRAGLYAGVAFMQVTGDTVLYLNPAIADAPWAVADKFVCRIGHHSFFRA